MVIRSKKTGLEHRVSVKDWEKMVDRGDSRLYVVVQKTTKKPTPPADVAEVKATKRKEEKSS